MAGLASLLGLVQQGAGTGFGTPPFNPEAPPVEGEPIIVTAPPSRINEDQQEMLPSYRNNDILEEMGYVQGEAPQRKGMFGTKGTLRDVLGLLGDTFLMGSGSNPIYYPRRQQERLGDAMVGYGDSPEASQAAIARAMYENPQAGLELAKQYGVSENQRMTREQQAAAQQSLIEQRKNAAYDSFRKYSGQLLSGVIDNPARFPAAYQVLQQQAQRAGVDLAEMGIYPDMTPDEIALAVAGQTTINQQQNLPLRERSVATGERNATTSEYNARTNRQRANTYSSVARPRADTNQERYFDLAEKQRRGGTLTADEKAWMEKQVNTGKRSRLDSLLGDTPVTSITTSTGRRFTPIIE